jgi:hypothetical protein
MKGRLERQRAVFRVHSALLVIVALLLSIWGCRRSEFDSGRWKSCAGLRGSYAVRSGMTKALIDSQQLIGIHEPDVLSLLGQPDAVYRGPFDQATVNPRSEFFGHRADVEYNYYVSGYLDPDVVAVYFKDGKVYKVVRHPT